MIAIETLRMPAASRAGGIEFVSAIGAAIKAFNAHRNAAREERQALRALARLSPRLLADRGLDAEAIYGAFDGTWDERGPAIPYPGFPRVSKN